MNPGQLDRRLTFQSLVQTRGADGSVKEGWADVRTVWGSKVEQGAAEFVAAGVLKAETTVLFRCRWWPELTGKHRILCDGKIYTIVLPTEEGRRNLWRIQARGQEAPK
jgi:SPP1 family predicted phage head-tail adaptor